MPDNYEIRPMRPGEINLAIDWAAEEGWNPGLHDAAAFLATDPEGFLIGLLDGEPIACISATNYDDSFGFLGFYIVRPKFRGQGYGLAIWDGAMAHHGDRNVGLDGVVAQQHNYAKSGFVLLHRNIRYEGAAWSSPGASAHLVELSAVPFEQLSAYDRGLFPANREAFLRRWIALPDSHALASVEDGELKGYAAIRSCRTAYRIGPLFADNEDIAESLFTSLTARLDAGTLVHLDVPELNPAAVRLAERHNMTQTFPTARMYNRGRPPMALDKIFGITTLELG